MVALSVDVRLQYYLFPIHLKSQHRFFVADRHRLRIITSTIMTDTCVVLLGAKPKYSDLLVLDRKFRDSAVELFGVAVGELVSNAIYNC